MSPKVNSVLRRGSWKDMTALIFKKAHDRQACGWWSFSSLTSYLNLSIEVHYIKETKCSHGLHSTILVSFRCASPWAPWEGRKSGPDLLLYDNPLYSMEEWPCLWLKRCHLVPYGIHSGWRICKVNSVEYRYDTCWNHPRKGWTQPMPSNRSPRWNRIPSPTENRGKKWTVDPTNKKYRTREESSYIPNLYVEPEICGYLFLIE